MKQAKKPLKAFFGEAKRKNKSIRSTFAVAFIQKRKEMTTKINNNG